MQNRVVLDKRKRGKFSGCKVCARKKTKPVLFRRVCVHVRVCSQPQAEGVRKVSWESVKGEGERVGKVMLIVNCVWIVC
jgi:hypothetical protein